MIDPTEAGSRVGRARWTPGQLWQVPTFLIGLSAFLAVAATSSLHHPTEARHFDATLRLLRQGLDKGQTPANLVPLAESLLSQVHLHGDRAAEVHFLAGSVSYRVALSLTPEQARFEWPRVVDHLEEATQIGVDERDAPALDYRLGRALYALDRDVPRALELLARSVDRAAEQPLVGYQLLLDAYLKLSVPDLDKAIGASRKIVELTDDRDADGVAQARLAHAELLLKHEQRGDAIRELDRISGKVSRGLRTRARLLQAKMCEQEGLWSKARSVWEELAREPAEVPGGKAHALYAIGTCSLQLEAPDYSRAVKAWQEALAMGGPEGQAAGLRLGELRLFGPSTDVAEALDDWRRALDKLETQADYRNAYIPLEDARKMFDQALSQFQDAQDYEHMEAVAALYRKLLPAGQADEKVALAEERLAKKLQQDPDPPTKEVRVRYAHAGELWWNAAQARAAKEGFDALWHSAVCFLQAQDADQASRALTQLHELNQHDVRLAEGWYRLAELRRTSGKAVETRDAYYRAMQYATTAYAAKARSELAHEALESKNWDKAAEILEPNLVGAGLDRETHEKSLFDMAWVQLQRRDFGRAAFYLDKATVLYPNNRRALIVRLQLADCYRQFADDAYRKEQKARDDYHGAPASEDLKVRLKDYLDGCRTARQDWLRKAVETYQKLADVLREREAQRPLQPLESEMGRRAVLAMAECFHERGEYLEALRLYVGLMQRNRQKVESLIACERIVQLNKLARESDLLPSEGQTEVATTARTALYLALEDLKRMDPNSPSFQGKNVWSWERWHAWASSEQQRLSAPAGAPPTPAKASLYQ